jgi:hypothetical protein
MITLLTSELNRINQGCGEYGNILYMGTGYQKCGLEDLENKGQIWLCPSCQKEKETLKKVSLMWADEMLDIFDYDEPIRDELLQIKSLTEKA